MRLRDWMDDVHDLASMVASRSAFLAEIGVDPDLAGIADEVDPDETMGDDTLLAVWFDRVAERFAGDGPILAHRHLRVDDFDAFVASVEEGVHPGRHWSLWPDTDSPDPELRRVDVMLTAEIQRSSICWASTFQAWFSYPGEREVTVEGDVARLVAVDMRTDERRDVVAGVTPSPGLG